jgi:hypothetical protein
MLVIVSSLCVIAYAVLAGRFHLAKARLTEKSIDDAILRGLRRSSMMAEMTRLREANVSMRNLLIDFVENEAQAPVDTGDLKRLDVKRAFSDRQTRRRELFGEAVFVLEQERAASRQVSGKRVSDIFKASVGTSVRARPPADGRSH